MKQPVNEVLSVRNRMNVAFQVTNAEEPFKELQKKMSDLFTQLDNLLIAMPNGQSLLRQYEEAVIEADAYEAEGYYRQGWKDARQLEQEMGL